jgi:hypothetical protein
VVPSSARLLDARAPLMGISNSRQEFILQLVEQVGAGLFEPLEGGACGGWPQMARMTQMNASTQSVLKSSSPGAATHGML